MRRPILPCLILIAGLLNFGSPDSDAAKPQTSDSSLAARYALDLELKLLSDKERYSCAEPIWIDILLINRGEDSVRVVHPRPEIDYFRFVVVRGQRDTLQYMGRHDGYTELPRVMLPPGDTMYNVCDLADAYPYSPESEHPDWIPLTGTINVTAIYPGSWSNTLTLQIERAAPAETEAYAIAHSLREYRCKNRKESAEQLLNLSPAGVYAQFALQKLIDTYHGYSPTDAKRDTMRLRVHAEKMLKEHRNSGYALRALSNLLALGSLGEKQAVLDSLLSEDLPFRYRMIVRNLKKGYFFAY